MARPGIVRADTIDLQDHDAPSAQDHSHSPRLNQGPVAAHQAAEIRHVLEERHSEEQSMQEVWSHNPNDINIGPIHLEEEDEDGHVDEITHDQLHAQQNGSHDDGDHSEADSDTAVDDDMMDRISSSPSIDDGAYTNPSPAGSWPGRSSSLTPTRGTFNRSASSTPNSSPFLHSPMHLPLSVHQGSLPDTPPSTLRSSSPFEQVPAHLPLYPDHCQISPLVSKDHHLDGEYASHDNDDDEGFYDYETDTDEYEGDINEDRSPSRPSFSWLRQSPVRTGEEELTQIDRNGSEEMIAMEIQATTIPDNNNMLSKRGQQARLASPTGSSSSWSTISDASISANVNPEDPETQDDDAEDFSFYDDERFVDSGWGGECLRDTEDIDFDFVYALHTFVATVEGQANAQKGDTMVLLDDSNSYWWLVRIVKDSSIGYLPAEHIETPTERLARLNKHRNVDLSATMLGDSPEKTKNPLKKAMRRRNAKTVQFAAPTYVEASDYDYSSDEEENTAADAFINGTAATASNGGEVAANEHTENLSDAAATANGTHEAAPARDSASPVDDGKAASLESQGSPTMSDKSEAAPLKSKKAGARNTDSFLKDDGAVTRKITLTPNLLRDGGTGSNPGSFEKVRSNSLESLEKIASPPVEKLKEDKKKKEKKPGMLSGLFKSKKKDKKSKNDEESDVEKVSGEMSRMSTAQSSGRTSPIDRIVQPSIAEPKTKGKLQKTNPSVSTATPEPSRVSAIEPLRAVEPAAPMEFIAELEGSQVAYEAPTGVEGNLKDAEQPHSKLASITNRIRTSDSQDKPKKAKKSKRRVELDDFDELDEEDEQPQPNERLSESPVEIPRQGAFMDGTDAVHIPTSLDEGATTPEEVVHQDAVEQDEESSTVVSSPSMVEVPSGPAQNEPETDDDATPKALSPLQTTHTLAQPTPPPARQAPQPPQRDYIPERAASLSSSVSSRASPSPTTPVSSAWSDAGLRRWLDGSQNDIKDMLVVINDKSEVVPAGPEHPIMAGLYVEESKKLQGFREELDGLLGGLFSRRKGRNTPTPTPKPKSVTVKT